MALIVAPVAGANSLCSVEFADAYHLARANAAWAALSTGAKEAALIRATDYIGQTYGQRFRGIRVLSTQTLDWPRYGVVVNGYDVDGAIVPIPIANACAELALRGASSSLAPDIGRLKSRVKVGPIETEYVAGSSGLTRFTAVDNMLAAYLGTGSSMIPVVRA